MGRGKGTKGGNRTGRKEEADWLGGGGDGGDSCCGPQYVPREEKPRCVPSTLRACAVRVENEALL